MTSIDMVSLLTIIYVLVDDWYQEKGRGYMQGKPGAKPAFSDSEMLTLMLAQDFIPYPGETQCLGYMRANHLKEFPQLVDQSQYNRRARGLWQVLEALRQVWVQVLGGDAERQLLLDTKPVNQAQQNPVSFDALLKRLRERIESTFNQLQNTGRFLERLLAKTPHGLFTRVIAKVAALVLRFLLNKRFGIDVLSFSIVSD